MLNIWYRGLPVVECVFTSSPFIENVCASSLCIQRSWSMCLSQRCQKGMKRRKKFAKMFNFILDVLRHTIFTSKTYTHTLQRGSKLYRTRTTIFFAVSFIISCTYVRCICYESTKLCDRYTTMCTFSSNHVHIFSECLVFSSLLWALRKIVAVLFAERAKSEWSDIGVHSNASTKTDRLGR